MPEAGVELTITLRQAGVEQAQAEMAKVDQQMRVITQSTSTLDAATRRSISKYAIALNLIVSSALAITDMLGVQIEAVYRQLIGVLVSFVNQLLMISISMSAVPGMQGVAMSAAAASSALQAVAVVQTNADMREAVEQLRAAGTIMRNFSTGLRSLGGT